MRLLMCRPDYFDVTYEINTWMRIVNGPDVALAQKQWAALHAILSQEIGADVSLVAPQPGLPDMVFTANAGITKGDLFIPSRFRFAERQGEVPHFIEWFQAHGFRIQEMPSETHGSFEGEGDALFYRELGRMLNCRVLPLELIDTRWYHLDTCLFPLAPDLLAYFPPAFDSYANTVLENLPGDKIMITPHDALRFGGNAVVAGDHVVMNAGCETLAEALQSRGYKVHAADLSEFLKSGGSAKCLTLVLDH
jgi:N-dimethylarginine dimethylaminohydrolase